MGTRYEKKNYYNWEWIRIPVFDPVLSVYAGIPVFRLVTSQSFF